jgi:GNAT superfamily N-acetyltransferase
MRAQVRRATPEDVPAIARLRRAWVEEQAGSPIDDEDFETELAEWFLREQHQRVTWLAEVGRRPVGMVNLMVFTRMPKPRSAAAPGSARRWGYVANVYVEPTFRNEGTGRALLDEVVSYAEAGGFARLVLSPSRQSVSLYERAGFVPATSLMIREGG